VRHILQVVHGLGIGGTERVVANLARAFNSQEFRTTLCCLDEVGEFGEQLRKEGFAVHLLGRRPGVDLSLVPRLRRLYRKEQISIVHAHQYTPYFYAATAALGRRLPIIFTEHGRHFPDRLRFKRAIVNQLLRVTTRSAYTAVSKFTRESMVRYEKLPDREIRVFYNGIHLNGEQLAIQDRERLRKEAGLDRGNFLILSIGRIDPVKDFATLIKAFSYVVSKHPDAHLWIAGDGDVNYKIELVGLVDQLGLAGKVRLLGARDDVSSLLCASDLFAISSITEATSMTILEAMAAFKPVLATRTGGNSELVVQGETGILVPVGDVRAMAEALHSLLEDPSLRLSMGEAGRRRVEKHFSSERIFAQYRRLYESI
jgi:L-malate glycosyltransferase